MTVLKEEKNSFVCNVLFSYCTVEALEAGPVEEGVTDFANLLRAAKRTLATNTPEIDQSFTGLQHNFRRLGTKSSVFLTKCNKIVVIKSLLGN